MNPVKASQALGVALFLLMSLEAASAQQPTPPTNPAPTLPGFTKLSDAVVAQFRQSPDGFLANYAAGGLSLSAQVRNLVLTDPSLVDRIIDLAKKGNAVQKAAMGTGLAQAARYLVASNPVTATEIQQKIAASGLPELITAFVAGSSTTQTAATGAGAGGGGLGGGNGGPTGGVSNGAGTNGGSTPGTSSFGAVNTSGSFGVSGSSGGATGFQKNSVSPI